MFRKNSSYPHLPCLDLGKDNKTPMELCKTVTTNKTSLTPKEQADMVRATAVPSGERQNNIMRLFEQSNVGSDPILKVILIIIKINELNTKYSTQIGLICLFYKLFLILGLETCLN